MSPSPSTFRPVSLDTLRDLTAISSGPCVSIYGRASLIPSLLAEANFRLIHSVIAPGADDDRRPVAPVQQDLAHDLLAPLRSVVNRTSLQDDTSVALFTSPSVTCAVEVPVSIQAGLSIDDAFGLGPLLSLFAGDCVYAVRIALEQPAILRVTASAVEPLDASALQCRPGRGPITPVASSAVAMSSAVASSGKPHRTSAPPRTHAAGPPQERAAWLSRLDKLLTELLPRPNHPIFLAGPDDVCSLFESMHPHRRVLPDTLEDVDDPCVLAHAARRASQSFAMQQRRDALIQFYELQAYAPHRASTDVSEITAAARSRRIETLFIDEALSAFEPPSCAIGDGAPTRAFGGEAPTTPSPVTSHVVEHAVAHTLIGGGAFYPMHGTILPPGTRMAALLRY